MGLNKRQFTAQDITTKYFQKCTRDKSMTGTHMFHLHNYSMNCDKIWK